MEELKWASELIHWLKDRPNVKLYIKRIDKDDEEYWDYPCFSMDERDDRDNAIYIE